MALARITQFILAVLSAATFTATIAASPDVRNYPSKPVRIIVPYPPGGGADRIARIVGQQLSERLKQPFLLENIGGASNTIGMSAVARAAADGYTLGLVTPVFVMTPNLIKQQSYDPLKDLTPVAMLGGTPLLLVVHPSVAANNVKELIQLAKKNSTVLNYGSLGSATTQGLAALMFASETRLGITQVPYKGSAPATTDLLAGHIQMMFNAMPSMVPHVRAGKLRALAITSAKRNSLLPDVPPLADDVPGYEVTTWYGLVAPAGTPVAVIDLLNREIEAVLKSPAIEASLIESGLDPNVMSVAAFDAYLKSESKKWSKVIVDANIKPD